MYRGPVQNPCNLACNMYCDPTQNFQPCLPTPTGAQIASTFAHFFVSVILPVFITLSKSHEYIGYTHSSYIFNNIFSLIFNVAFIIL